MSVSQLLKDIIVPSLEVTKSPLPPTPKKTQNFLLQFYVNSRCFDTVPLRLVFIHDPLSLHGIWPEGNNRGIYIRWLLILLCAHKE